MLCKCILVMIEKQSNQKLKIFLRRHSATAKRLNLDLDDLFNERINYISKYCAHEELYFVLWTRPYSLTAEQIKRAAKDKLEFYS